MKTRLRRWTEQAGVLWILAASPLLVGGAPVQHAAGATRGAPRGDALLGEWWTQDNEGRVRFTQDPDGTFRGTTTCCSRPDEPDKDIHNPDPKLRDRSTVGIVIIWKLAYEDGEYARGYVYNPRDGKTYRFAAEIVDDDSVRVRGYLLIPLLGQSQVWKRARQHSRAPTLRSEEKAT